MNDEIYIKAKVAQELIGCCRTTLDSYVKRGFFKAYKLTNGSVRFCKNEILAFIKSRANQAI